MVRVIWIFGSFTPQPPGQTNTGSLCLNGAVLGWKINKISHPPVLGDQQNLSSTSSGRPTKSLIHQFWATVTPSYAWGYITMERKNQRRRGHTCCHPWSFVGSYNVDGHARHWVACSNDPQWVPLPWSKSFLVCNTNFE